MGEHKGEPVVIGTGMPASIALELFGRMVEDAFGETAYQVGSSVRGKDWRDVDVRVMLPTRRFRLLFGDPRHASLDPRWRSVCWAFSLLGREMTGLPVDFQVQDRDDANERHHGFRQPLIEHRRTP